MKGYPPRGKWRWLQHVCVCERVLYQASLPASRASTELRKRHQSAEGGGVKSLSLDGGHTPHLCALCSLCLKSNNTRCAKPQGDVFQFTQSPFIVCTSPVCVCPLPLRSLNIALLRPCRCGVGERAECLAASEGMELECLSPGKK